MTAVTLNYDLLYFLCLTAGWLLGILTGTIPGIHVNTISAILVSLSPFLRDAGMPVMMICLIILSCAISNTFHNIIPAVFLGAPGEDTAFAAMPGHRLLMNGKGPEAVRLSAAGSIGAVLASPILMLPLALFLFLAYPFLVQYLGYILLMISLTIILTEPSLRQKAYAFFLFAITGVFGVYVFQVPDTLFSETSVLLPLFGGLFGAPQLLISLMTENANIPESKETAAAPYKLMLRSIIHGTFFGALVSWIPGVSSSVAAILSGLFIGDDEEDKTKENDTGESDTRESDTRENENTGIVPENDFFDTLLRNGAERMQAVENSDKEYIIAVSSINTANALFGLAAYAVIHKSRSGAVVAMDGLLREEGILLGNMAWSQLTSVFLYFYAVAVLCSFLSFFSTVRLGASASSFLKKIRYGKIAAASLIFLAAVVFALTGVYGMFVFFAAAVPGLLAVFMRVRKANLMSVILVPVMLYFL